MFVVELVNTQVVLQGVEQVGYVVASSHLTNIIGCDHEPKMKKGVYVSKKSWVAKIQDLQVRSYHCSHKESLGYCFTLSTYSYFLFVCLFVFCAVFHYSVGKGQPGLCAVVTSFCHFPALHGKGRPKQQQVRGR